MTRRTRKAYLIEMPQDQLEALAFAAKALSHPARIAIVRLLLSRTTCVGGDIVEEIGLAQSTTSEHLRILKAAGIIVGDPARPRVSYSLAPAALVPLAGFLKQMAKAAGAPAGAMTVRQAGARQSATTKRLTA